MSNFDQGSAPAGGFGKMLNSLQGLQQRLEDFSTTDVANAEANAQTLILRLRQFQNTINALAVLKNAAADIDRSIAAIQPIDVEVVNLDDLENHPQLHAIVKVSKLIKLHKLMTALKAGSDEGASIEQQAGIAVTEAWPTVESAAPSAAAISDTSELSPSHDELAATPDSVDDLPAAVLAGAAATIPVPIVEPATQSPTVAAAASDEIAVDHHQSQTDFPTAQAEFETAVAAVVKPASGNDAVLGEDFPAPGEPSSAKPLADSFPHDKPDTKSAQPVETKPKAKPAQKKNHKSAHKGDAQLDTSKALVPANDSFDLRLLDDLVSNYGEFAASPNLPATIKNTEIENIPTASSAAQELPPEQPSPVEETSPAVKNTREIDRQLKKIVKEYGEYDLYSDKPTANIKKAGILAFVFLGLVFGGIYFFKAPPSTAKTSSVSANNPGSAAPAEQHSQPSAEPASGEQRDSALGSGTNVAKPTAKK